MAGVYFDEEVPFRDQPALAAAVICRTEEGNLHAGILHRSDGTSTVEVLHLGWQDCMRRDWQWRRLWAAPDEEPEVLRSVSGICRLVWKTYAETRQFAYGLGFEGVSAQRQLHTPTNDNYISPFFSPRSS